MNLQEYLNNPMGQGDSSVVNRRLLIDNLNTAYNDLIATKKITYSIYRDTKVSFLIHLIVPSTNAERDNTYDVVIRFTPATRDIANEKSIRNYDIQVFTNTPSFTYTFAKVYDEHDMLIKSLKTKFSKKVFDKDPVQRNRFKIVNYEKYIYIAIKYILDSKILMSKEYLIGNAKIYNSKKFLTIIRDVETIMVEYERSARKVREKKRIPMTSDAGITKTPMNRVKEPKVAKGAQTSTVKKITPVSAKQPKKPRSTVVKKKF